MGFLREIPAGTPDDLKLTPAEVEKSEALSHLAWGFFLQYEGQASFDRISSHYLKAVEVFPESRLVLKRLISPWLVSGEHGKIADALAPIAKQKPRNARLQLLVVTALRADGRNNQGADLLRDALERNDWSTPSLLPELVDILLADDRQEELARLMRRIRKSKAMRYSFGGAYASALFYDAQCSHDDWGKLSKRSQAKLLRLRDRHVVSAATQITPDLDPRSLGHMLSLLVQQEAWEEACSVMERLETGGYDLTGRHYVHYVQALLGLGEYDDALDLASQLRDGFSLRPPTMFLLGRIFQDSNFPEQAAHWYESVVLAVPGMKPPRIRLAYLCLRLERPEKGLVALQTLRTGGPRLLFLRARLQQAAGRSSTAFDLACRAERIARASNDESFLDAGFLLPFAVICEEAGQWDRALAAAQHALHRNPNNPACQNFLGYILADRGLDLPEAERLIHRAIACRPENVPYLDSLAWVFHKQGRRKPARRVIEKALRLANVSQRDPVILDHAGDIYHANHLKILARLYWSMAQAASPDPALQKRLEKKLTDLR
ncbi:MAG: tetratricopeptide repeat protein [Lentisphaeria bacterium]|nr:tetratricopeptide repeat protein [Lentisphaeria bacterium]